jgi:LytS/YehU family sensor histidine kinase
VLQAQIEPHFLFNTLAHVQSAIDQDPATGKLILENLIRYLRGTLRRTRSVAYSLTDERDLIEALLNIASIRIGPRLRYQVNIADEVGKPFCRRFCCNRWLRMPSSTALNRPLTAVRSGSRVNASTTHWCYG